MFSSFFSGGNDMYIHYGSDAFDPDRFKKIANCAYFNKPLGDTGFWASPVDAKNGWKTWCENESFNLDAFDEYFCFELAEGAKVFHIRKGDDIYDLPLIKNPLAASSVCIDFEEAAKSWDAIEAHISDDPAEDYRYSIYWLLYGWDCDSILIMNPDIIKEVKR